jgi:hypothetical protein
MLVCMTDTPLCNLYALARKLGLSAAWLKTEANAGRIPCLKVGRRLRFNPAAVERVLSTRASGDRADGMGVRDVR